MANRRLTQRGQQRRQQLMDYATERFAENGYHPTSVAEIVSGLGVGKGVFYWYFDSKDELFLEILKQSQRDLRRHQHAAIAETDDPVERIALGIRATLEWSSAHADLNRLVQFAATEERFLPALRRGREVAAGDAQRHVIEGIASGRLRDLDPAYIAHGIIGITAQLARVFLHEQDQPWEAVADAAVSMVLEGILVDS
ncbi:MAG: TetR/AcrR family transcriptional regulator [Acidimicrobiales bacterium]